MPDRTTDQPGPDDPAPPGPAPAWLRASVLGLTAMLVFGGAAALVLTGVAGPSGRASAPVVGRPMPDFRATTVDGRPVSLAQFRGRPVWLTFGATWCPPCRAESPDLQAAQDTGGDSGVVVLAVYLSEDADDVRDFAGRLGLRYPQIADPDRELGSAYRVVGLPTHFVIDRSGVLRVAFSGGLTAERITAELARL